MKAMPVHGPLPPIPLTVITGFLGAGKTTLLNRLLRDPALADSVVIINEFGEVGLDHLLVERVDDSIVLLQSGCLCCTIRGDLITTLENLLRQRDNGRVAPFQRVILETTGLADPAPVLQTVMGHPYLSLPYDLAGVVTVVDAVNGLSTLDTQPEAEKQAAMADVLLLSKTDLIFNADQANNLRTRLAALNPIAAILPVSQFDGALILQLGLYEPGTKTADVRRWLHEEDALARLGVRAHRHADGTLHVDGEDTAASDIERGQSRSDPNRHSASIQAHALQTDEAISAESFALFQELLRSAHGPKLLRFKGLIKIAERPENPVVVHGVQHVFHDPVILERWPDDDRRTRMIFITRDLEPAFIEKLWNAFLKAGRGDDRNVA